MEWRIKDYLETCDLKRSNGKYQLHKSAKRESVSIIRYADDFVILHKDLTVIQGCREVISEWLKDMGLELKPSKTRLTHSLNEHEGEKPGFDFLGYHIQQHRVGKYTTGKDGQKNPLGFKTIITPSKVWRAAALVRESPTLIENASINLENAPPERVRLA